MIGVGDLVVCVDASERGHWHPDHIAAARQLREGSTYCVRAIAPRDGIFLCGVRAGAEEYGYGFAAERFRKVQHDKQEACETEFKTLLNRKRVSA